MDGFNPLMSEALRRRGVVYLDSVDSTNTRAKQLARQGAPHMTLVLADSQTQGRGRRGRDWLSRPGLGAWMSLIVRPRGIPSARAPELVMVAAVALCEAISGLSGIALQIKWPNDMVAGGKKLVGTLLEMGAAGEMLDWAVIGAGVNILDADFPGDMPDAGSIESVSGRALPRASVVEAFLCAYERAEGQWVSGGMDAILPRYKRLSSTLGARVRAICPDGEYQGVAEDIQRDGALLLRLPDGSLRALYAGDVSVRGMERYV